MRLDETFKNCLLALASRYPKSLVDVNQNVPGPHRFLAEAWPLPCSPVMMVELLQAHASRELAAPARLVIDGQEHAIYLLEQSQKGPVFWIHYRRESTMRCKERLETYLQAQRVPFLIQQHPRAFRAHEIAESEHIPGKMVAKTVIVFADHQMIWLVLPASCLADLDQVRRALGVQEVRLAHEAEMAAAFPDCPVGTLPPFGNLYGAPVYVEKNLAEEGVIVFPAGCYTETMCLNYADFERLAHPVVLAFARKRVMA